MVRKEKVKSQAYFLQVHWLPCWNVIRIYRKPVDFFSTLIFLVNFSCCSTTININLFISAQALSRNDNNRSEEITTCEASAGEFMSGDIKIFPRFLAPPQPPPPSFSFPFKNHISFFRFWFKGSLVSQPLFSFTYILACWLVLFFYSVDFQDCLLPSLDLIGTCKCAFNINTTNIATLLVRSSWIDTLSKNISVDNINVTFRWW